VTAGFSFDDELKHLHLNPVGKPGCVQPSEDWRWSNDDRSAGEKATIAGSPIPVTDVRLP
jgi:hypothetical protein